MAVDTDSAVRLRIKRGFMVLEGIAALLGVVATGTNLAAGDWLGAALFGVLTVSIAFQTLQAAGALTVHAGGIEDTRVLGPGEVPWDAVVRVRVGDGGLLRPPLSIDVEGRARPVIGAASWTLAIEVGGQESSWDDAREEVVAHARAAGVEVRRGATAMDR